MIDDVAAVLLAAGGGSRFDGPTHKLLASLHGRPVVAHALESLRRAGFPTIVVVTGAVELPASVDTTGLTIVSNPRWAQGQATSVQTAIAAVRDLAVDAVVVGLGDQPFISPDAWRHIAASQSPIAVATYAGSRGNPVRLHRSIWDLLPREGDQGARSLIRLRPELVSEVACTGSPADIDTMEDLQRWNSSTNSR
jgi:molybdenum cofactor cytidylyltransferase